jgi:hypothetical protein
MVDVEYDLSTISDLGEPKELLVELAAIKPLKCSVFLTGVSDRIEEAYYAAQNKEAVKPDAYETSAKASGPTVQ